jgi:hypothetical protein
MARRRTLSLAPAARAVLTAVRDHDPHPQMRERAAALVKIADGMSPHAVARTGLLRPRDPDSVYGWLDTYQTGGLAALRAHLHGGSHRGRFRRPADRGPGVSAPGSGGSRGTGPA